MKKILVIVDFQYDFCNPKGALYVPGAEKAQEAILREIESGKYDFIVFTADFHPSNHCSFKENGGEWPTHCVENTEGAEINSDLYAAAKMIGKQKVWCFRKGKNHKEEEYGIDLFWNVEVCMGIWADYTICGLAGDYCVLETLRMNMSNNKCEIFLDGIASIDGGKKLNDFIKENNIKIC